MTTMCIPRLAQRAGLTLAATLWALTATPALAEPIRVTLYPDLARVREAASVAVGRSEAGERASLTLPPQADPTSLALYPPAGVGIESLRWERGPRQDSQELKGLKAELAKAEGDLAGLKARDMTLGAQIDFWRDHSKEKQPKETDLAGLAQTMAKYLLDLYKDRYALAPRLMEAEHRVKELRERLAAMSGSKEEGWTVEVRLSRPDRPDKAPGQVALEYEYDLAGAGWTAGYRIEARPGAGLVHLAMEAEAWQASGADWRDVDLALVTNRPSGLLAPPVLPVWRIGPARQAEVRPLLAPLAKGAGDAGRAEGIGPAAEMRASAPTLNRQTTFDVWRLGRRTVPAGGRQRLPIKEADLKARFERVLRPSVSPQAYLLARLSEEPASTDLAGLAPGPAVYLVDGAMVGLGEFGLEPGKVVLSFGVDPLVTATLSVDSQGSGEKGLMRTRQTYAWRWRIDVASARPEPVAVRVEEPRPLVLDERIELAWSFEPKAEEAKGPDGTALLVWNGAVGPQGWTLHYGLSLTAPEDMELDLGWRR